MPRAALPPGPGRPKGSQNKVTREVKATMQVVFDQLQGMEGVSLLDWAVANPGEFYKTCAIKLVPTDSNVNVGPIEITVKRAGT